MGNMSPGLDTPNYNNPRNPQLAARGLGAAIFGNGNTQQHDNLAAFGNTLADHARTVQPLPAAHPGDGYASGAQGEYSPQDQYNRQQAQAREAWDRSRQGLAGMQFQTMANPYGENNQGLRSMLDQNRGEYGGGLTSALLDNRRNAAMHGITQDSGLAQQQDLQTRQHASEGLSAMNTASRAQNYGLGAQFDERQQGLLNQFNQLKSQALASSDYNQGNALYGQATAMLNQQNEQAKLPYQLEGLGLGNQNQRTANQYQGGMLGAQLHGINQQNDYNGQIMPYQVQDARNEAAQNQDNYDNRGLIRGLNFAQSVIPGALSVAGVAINPASGLSGLFKPQQQGPISYQNPHGYGR